MQVLSWTEGEEWHHLCICVFQTILLQDKQQKNYCVSCQELDSDIDKDNPGMHLKKCI